MVVLIFVAAVLTWSCDAFGVPTSPLDFRKSFVTSGLQISKGLVGAALVASLDKSPALAEELKDQVVVLGSNGKTGKLIVDLLAKSGEKVLPTYARTPPSMDSKSANVLKAAVADVTDQSSLTASLTGTFLSRADVARMRQTWLSSPAQGGGIRRENYALRSLVCPLTTKTTPLLDHTLYNTHRRKSCHLRCFRLQKGRKCREGRLYWCRECCTRMCSSEDPKTGSHKLRSHHSTRFFGF